MSESQYELKKHANPVASVAPINPDEKIGAGEKVPAKPGEVTAVEPGFGKSGNGNY